MPSWWARSSSKEVKKKTRKDNIIDTFHRFISPTDQKSQKSRGSSNTISEKGSRSRAESRSTSPSTHVSRCQSFADRPQAQPLPLPVSSSCITRTASELSSAKPILAKRGKQQLLLPLPTPRQTPKRFETTDTEADLTTASISSNCSNDSNDPADSQLPSPVGNDLENCIKDVANSQLRGQSLVKQKNLKDSKRPTNLLSGKQVHAFPKQNVLNNDQANLQIPRHGAFASAPDSSMSSPSRSPKVIFSELIPTSAFWAAKPNQDVAFLSSGQCSSPGSGYTSGHNSMGGEMLGQLWQHSRGSPECSPIPSPRIASSGPSSRIHSGAVSPLHPRGGGPMPESPSSRNNESRKQSHRLPLPPINISNVAPFPANGLATNASPSIPRSPGRVDTPTSPGSRWKKGKMIGHGTFGHVYVGFNSESGEMCAMKEVTLFMDDAKSKESAKQLGQEISLLSRLRHPNIVQYYGSAMVDDKLYIYLEYVSGGSIYKLLQEYGQFGEPAIRSYTQQILSGLAYLHAKNTVHRDIKGANILVDPNGRVKLADFGMAKHITGQSCPLSFKGSPYWMAPEVIKNSNGCNLAVDIWSLGCTVFEMSTSKPPWSQYEGIAAMFKIGNSKELPAMPDNLSADGKNFILQCLQRDPSKRPTAADLLHHPFVKNAAPVEKPIPFVERIEQPLGASNGSNLRGIGHTRNLSSLDMEGLAVNQISDGKPTNLVSDPRARYISCPVSPIGSPLLNSRSQHHINGRMSPSPISSPRTISGTSTPLARGYCGISGRMSPSPISSPRTTSGASTPLVGANGAILFNQPKKALNLHEGLTSSPRFIAGFHPNGTIHNEPKLDLFLGMHQALPNQLDRVASDTHIMGPQFGKPSHGSPWESMLSGHSSQIKRDQMKLKPCLDVNSGSLNLRHKHGI